MFRHRFLLTFAMIVGGICLAAVPARAGNVYVDANATGPAHDGTSWCQAYLTLDEALESASLFDSILVAGGTYTPDPTGLFDPRDATFHLRKFVEIYGGYAGCGAADPDERDLRLYETILSGDLDGDDGTLGGDNSENCYHVVTGSSPLQPTDQSAVLDGVTITAGNANLLQSGFRDRAGGFISNSGDPSLRRCRIVGNEGKRAGGVYNYVSDTTFIDCVIANNTSSGGAGGLMDVSVGFVEGATLVNCLILDNKATGGTGGGIVTNEADTRLDDCTIYGNYSVSVGGGIYAQISNPQFTNCILWGNEDFYGTGESSQVGGVNTAPVLDYCWVQGWTGDLAGENSFGTDPRFVPGPLGCLYLSQIDAGEPEDSPCVDGGDDTAANVGFDDTVTTRSDELADMGMVDVGYHYPVTGEGFLIGDYDRNGIIDLTDFAQLQNCFTAEGPADVSPCCRIFDVELDQDVDLLDYSDFAALFDPP